MSKHMKRLSAPRAWHIGRKTHEWVMATRPGPHPKDASVPLLVVVRDLLGLVQRGHEAKKIINDGKILVDGRVCRDPKRAVGLMDVVSAPAMEQHWRAVLDRHGRIRLVDIDENAAQWKLARVTGVTNVKGGKFQIATHDGRTFLVREKTASPGDTLQIRVPTQEVMTTFPLKEGAPIIVTGGSHSGELGTLEDIELVKGSAENRAKLKIGGETARTTQGYVFVVGKDQHLVRPHEEVQA